jgi:hypothetical protein
MSDMDHLSKMDQESYQRAYEQASQLEKVLQYTGCSRLIIDVGEIILELDILHVDVLNEVFEMLNNLKQLKDRI